MPRTPSSTYRLQLHAGFNFDAASEIADYLWALGISHVYASPYLQTAPGSTHGYDVADFKSVNEELGGAEAQERFCLRLGQNGLGQILDIVPNHMSLAPNNPYWRDVLENGPESPYATYFDIDWDMGEERMRDKVLLPVLENQYGLVLTSGAIELVRNDQRFEIVHGGNHLPVAPHSLSVFLTQAAEAVRSDKLAFLADSFARLATRDRSNTQAIFRVQRDRRVLLHMLTEFLNEQPNAISAIDEAIAAINKDSDQLDEFLQRQHYRLAYWRAADQDLGYRRFFDVNSLIGVRVEREHVFLDTHALILDWLKRGVLDGVRVDHPDGLRDPQKYFERLHDHAPDAWVVVEKILARSEVLRKSWPVAGTSGYDFMNLVDGLQISEEGLNSLDEVYADILGHPSDFPTMVHEKKIAVTLEGLGSDVNWVTSIFVEICEADRDHRDHTRAEIRHAIREVAACFPVYRSYVSPHRDEVPEMDAAVIQTAIDVAAGYRPDLERSLFDFIADVLLMRRRGRLESEFLLRFQQFTSPVMAKGLEDTALYCYNRLVGLNEVGCSLANPVVSVDDFHRFNLEAQANHPTGMTALTTHDTKRGEDVRARLAVISEIPQHFAVAVKRWFNLNSVHRRENIVAPNTEYLYYQTLVGAWPINVERATEYMIKATREAKEQTSWTHNDERFEQALKDFITSTLNDKSFCSEIEAFVKRINPVGRTNSLAQTLLKYTAPGVPDLYQGSELWDHRLVDPDNRTPVDYDQRRGFLKEVQQLTVSQILDRMEEGLPKLWTIHKALKIRKDYADCFGASGDYEPLLAIGERENHVVAFIRGHKVATIVPRLPNAVADGWQSTTIELPGGSWKNAFTGATVSGGTVSIESLLSEFPIALLTKEI
jgi:(1->4)-alpha-D-glucan 1-alpha-D-glucosylmutase